MALLKTMLVLGLTNLEIEFIHLKNTVVFNARLVHNDGLLVASVSADSDISYAEADMWLTDAISELKFRLDNTETVLGKALAS